MPAYLDHAASTTLRPAAFEAMLPWLTERIGNPSGSHRAAREARRAVDDARDALATLAGASPGEVVFTSGGTEADNLAVLGVHAAAGGTVVASAIEHHAVLEAVAEVGGRLVAVDRCGRVDPIALADGLDPGVRLVSIMLVNNEIGTIQPLDELAALVRRHAPGAFVHTDAVQAATWLDLRQRAAAADLVSLSAHKLGGPKGVGALIVRSHVPLHPRLVGGGQERGRRSGTLNVAGIVAFGAAAAEADATREATVTRLRALRERLVAGLTSRVPGCTLTVPDGRAQGEARPAGPGGGPGNGSAVGGAGAVEVAAGIVHVCVEGAESEALLFLADQAGVCASAGSSCSSGAVQLSHVLSAIGVDPRRGRGALRLSLGWSSTEADVDTAIDALAAAAARLGARS